MNVLTPEQKEELVILLYRYGVAAAYRDLHLSCVVLDTIYEKLGISRKDAHDALMTVQKDDGR